MEGSTIGKLGDVLERECGVYTDILDLSKNKRDAIIKGRVSELEKLLEIEQNLIIMAGKLENEREELAGQLAQEKGIAKEDVNMSKLADFSEDDEAEELTKTRQKILDILGELKDTNELNSRLVRNSLEYINFSINLLNCVEAGSEGYRDSGRVSEGKGRNYLDVRL